MTEITHRTVEANGIRIHLAEAGSGPLVLLCHGFPESWYSWRAQLKALAEAGFRAVAPDLRGYGVTDRPEEIDKYTLFHLVGDMVGVVDALGGERAVIVGHDWGAPVAWNAALLRPDRFRGVVGLSVPFRPRGSTRPTSAMPQTATSLFYQLQEPGVAEAELERDPRGAVRRLLYSGSGDAPRRGDSASPSEAPMMVPRTGGFLSRTIDPERLPAWLTEDRRRLLRRRVRANGLSRRPQLVSQHRPQLGAHGGLRGLARFSPRALYRGRPRPRGPVSRR